MSKQASIGYGGVDRRSAFSTISMLHNPIQLATAKFNIIEPALGFPSDLPLTIRLALTCASGALGIWVSNITTVLDL